MKLTGRITAAALFAATCMFSGITAAQDQQSAEDQLRAALAEMAPDLPVTSIAESVLPGVYEVVSNAQVYYLSPNGRYLVEGSIIDLQNQVNVSEQRRGGLQLSLISEMPEEQMLVFNNEDKNAERWITVFTDTDCGFCQKLHREIDAITEADIKVRYLLFPRAGIDSGSSRELQSVWCADDQQEAMTIAKSGGTVDPATCENPIQSHMDLARQVELRGTPLIYLDNGTKIPGYRPANELIQMIEESEPLALGQ
jgi:thiol:disulfide interchange protein DsbC